MASDGGRRALTRAALAAVALSLCLNLIALYVPFLRVDVALRGSEHYTLPRSVILLWDAGLRLLALLVAVFSIAFPFGKLAVLAQVALGRWPARKRRLWLERVGRLGRWSMLDVFLAAILLGLTNERFFVDTEARVGLPLFALAIVLSLSAGELLELAEGAVPLRPPRRASSGERALLAVAWLALCGALVTPVMEVADWRMRDDAYSLLELTGALWSGAPSVGFLLAAFVVAVPLLELAVLTAAALARPARAALAARLRRRLGRWSMLEVFVLALAIFLAEGHAFVRAELSRGTLLLGAALCLHLVARHALESRLRRRQLAAAPSDREPPGPDPSGAR